MLGRTIDGDRAYQLGLVNQLAASAAATLTDAMTLAAELAAASASFPRGRKRCCGRRRDRLGEGIAREREVATELFATPDGQEGFAAFRERRVPAFAAGQPS